MRLIDAEATIKDIDAQMEFMKSIPIPELNQMADEIYKGFVAQLNKMPTIEPPTTTWLGNYCPYRCEHCGRYVDSKERYCPNCGRKATNYD